MKQHIINIQLAVEQVFQDNPAADVKLTDTGFTVVCYDLSMDGNNIDWTVPAEITPDSSVTSMVDEIQALIDNSQCVITDLKALKADGLF
jgi:hypothetical protein